MSPDGSHVAYVDDASGQFNISVQALKGGPARRLTSLVDSAVRRVVWHPSGRSLIFQADIGGTEKIQLFQVGIDGGDTQALTDTPEASFALAIGAPVSPDERRLAFSGNDRNRAVQDVLVKDLASGVVERVFDAGGRMYAGHWSPDGTRLTAVDWRENNSDHVVYLVGADGGAPLRLTPDTGEPAIYGLGPWLPDGSGFLVVSNAGREFAGLAVLDAETGELSWLDVPDWDVERAALSTDGKTLIWTVNIDGGSQFRGRDLSSGAALPLPELPMGVVREHAVSPDGRHLIFGFASATSPWNVVVLDLATGDLRSLTDNGPSVADPAGLVEPERVRYLADDGLEIPAALYRPRGVTDRVGVVLAIHGGPAAQELPEYSYDGFYQALLGRGLAVLAPDVRGSSGYGKSYLRLSFRDWGGGDLGDCAAAVRWLREQPWVDPDRIGVYGGSYGGFLTLSCVSRLADLNWAAAVDVCGPSNLVTFTRSQPPTWRHKVAVMVGDPDTDEDFLRSRSPVTYADEIRAPLFVVQGANDPRVPQPESDQIVERLRARGVPVRYDVYPDEGHGFSKRENLARMRTDVVNFLAEHLGPADRS
ncbi:S9 family peptidase [Virgisporangium ochraceum]|uniref:Acyl-peptide hydrolase n=1 Tax=Virgisporangium ochraceum TaxID=65505 RepID=A0A8J4EA66_9ACTN|nr:peptidase S9 [Virgisporangium ochraceum]